MKKLAANASASILARLRNQSDKMNRPFAEILQYYAMERFLYRLSKTRHADKFVLKGGLLFYVWNISLRRPTRDIDFRGYVAANSKTLTKIIREVIEVSAPEDGLVFDSQSILAEETQLEADYRGVRVRLTALLERARIPIQIDVGFSDELSSKAEPIEYPNILPELETVYMKGYPQETVIAEKFHAMIRHGELNSRMKDYYDLWLLSKTFEFEGKSLQKTIETIFKSRDTDLPVERPVSLSLEFASANNTRWRNFLDKMNIPIAESADFAKVIERVWEFIAHPLQASLDQSTATRNWSPNKGWK